MFIGNNLFARYAEYIDLTDRDFFTACLDKARETVSETITKQNAPIAFCSRLASQKTSESLVTRKTVHDASRTKRRYLMIDADYEPDQTRQANKLYSAARSLAETHRTPIMIYPTLSYPQKPRFRVVYLTRELMNAQRYEQAMIWLYDQLGLTATDPSDTRITTNRNLPAFCTEDQLDIIYSTFDNEALEPLDNTLWKNTPLPPKPKTAHPVVVASDRAYDTAVLSTCIRTVCSAKDLTDYNRMWYYIQAVAVDVLAGRLTDEAARETAREMAVYATDDAAKQQRWITGNTEMYEKHLDRLRTDESQLTRAWPLCAYSGFEVLTNKDSTP